MDKFFTIKLPFVDYVSRIDKINSDKQYDNKDENSLLDFDFPKTVVVTKKEELLPSQSKDKSNTEDAIQTETVQEQPNSNVDVTTHPKEKVTTYVVKNPYTIDTPMVLKESENDSIGIPRWSSVIPIRQSYTPIKDQSNIQIKTNPKIRIAEGVVLSKELKDTILNKMLELGTSAYITSSIREGAIAPSGKPSYHSFGEAFDIQPLGSDSPEAHAILYKQMKDSGLLKYLNDLGYYVYYEDKMRNPKSTGNHFHIGKDIKTNNPYVIKAKKGNKFIEPGGYFEQFSSYNDYTLPELSDPIKKLFGKNSDNVRKIIVELKDAGWNNRQIAAYLGNVYVESKANPHAENKKGGDYGLIQRVGARMEPTRSIPGLELASQLGYDIAVMAGNVSRDEMSNEWPSRNLRNKFLKGDDSVNRLTEVFMNGYERPSRKGKLSLPRRQAAAWEVYKFLK